jgi:uncharacterized protein (AIM24 family)
LIQVWTRSHPSGKSFPEDLSLAPGQGGEVLLAPFLPGDMTFTAITEPMLVQSGAYVESDMGVEIDFK